MCRTECNDNSAYSRVSQIQSDCCRYVNLEKKVSFLIYSFICTPITVREVDKSGKQPGQKIEDRDLM